jgi:hypothetical protein
MKIEMIFFLKAMMEMAGRWATVCLGMNIWIGRAASCMGRVPFL